MATDLLAGITAPLVHIAVIATFTIFLIARGLPIHGFALNLLQGHLKIFVCHAKSRKRPRRWRFSLLQNGKHQMFRANVLVPFFLGNLCRIEKGRLATRRKREKCSVRIPHGHDTAIGRKRTLDIFAQFIQIDLERRQSFCSKTGILADQAQQQMFSRYTVAAQVPSCNACRL